MRQSPFIFPVIESAHSYELRKPLFKEPHEQGHQLNQSESDSWNLLRASSTSQESLADLGGNPASVSWEDELRGGFLLDLA